ncbi:mannose-6-phosphate isomerase, class I [Microbacterium sp.]|uniref:mannose-6-phosphate isomerase, class I n=1 Tax=Microbacterium sp. TaxID=51671 RepID=UPI003A8C5FDF
MTISNRPRDYAWGSTTLLADLEGRRPSGTPEAEVWFGDHPGSPSRVDGGDDTLDRVRAQAGRPPLPFLVKLLAAGAPLSIQAHPSRAQAERGCAREDAAGIPRDAPERTYRDANHKPELIVAVSESFQALAGLRPLARTRRLLDGLGDAPGVRALAARLQGPDEATALRDTVRWLLSGRAQGEVAEIIAAVGRAAGGEFSAELTALGAIARAYPRDPGVVVALLMNLVRLRRGEALFVAAGVLHAYVAGLGVEVMAASDNVLRGGLTPKHIDVAELLSIVDTAPADPPVLVPRTAGADSVYDPGVPDFLVTRLAIDGDARDVALRGAAIAVVTAGEVTVAAGGVERVLRPGCAVYADAEDRIRVGGRGEVFLVGEGSAAVAET